MEGTDLKPKKKPVIIKIVIYTFIFLLTFFFLLFLYSYLWDILKSQLARSLSKDFYIERTETRCVTNADCSTACNLSEPNDSCLCLNSVCHLVDNAHQFAESKFCITDSDCTVSCYEGAINRSYYESQGGSQNDCTEGCMKYVFTEDGQNNFPVCINSQCQFRNGQSCFIGPIPKPH